MSFEKCYVNHIKKILINEEQIHEAIVNTGKIIDNMYDGTPILLVSILKGSFVFLADLHFVRNIEDEARQHQRKADE